MKTPLVYLDGHFFPLKRAKIPVLNSAYLYGEGLFEVLRVANEKILFWKEHYDRMKKSCGTLGLSIPVSKNNFYHILKKGIRKLGAKDVWFRVNLSFEEKSYGRLQRIPGRSILQIIFAPWGSYPQELYTNGAKLVFIKTVVNDPLPVSWIKAVSYLPKMMARKEVRSRGAHEGFLLNTKGHVTEAASSNFFIVKNGVLKTPPLSDGLLPGVTRKAVIKLAKGLKIRVQETHITPKDVLQADEVFLTSSLKDIMPVKKIEKKRINFCPGPITGRLMTEFQKKILGLSV